MSEEQAPERQFTIQRIYTKDLSFESPNAPQVFSGEWKPAINVGLQTQVNDLSGGNYEVVLTVNVEAKQDETSMYMAEVQQAAIFTASGFPDAELGPLLGIGAPTTLLPYAREAISDLITRGSFPQFVLQPVNFEAMFKQQMAQQQQQQQAETH